MKAESEVCLDHFTPSSNSSVSKKAMSKDLSQEVLQQRFKISRDQVLGEGSFAVVYRGLDTEALKNVAVKVYKDVDEETLASYKKSINVLLAIQNGTKIVDDENPKSEVVSEVGDAEEGALEAAQDNEWAERSTDWAEFATRSFDPRMVELPTAVRRRSSRGELMRKIDFSSCFVSVISYSKDSNGKPGLDIESESLFIVFELGMESLEDRLIRYGDKGRQLTADEHRSLQWALVSIVFGLHTMGYVHLDIKPANIVCFELEHKKEQWKLIDLDGALCTGTEVRLSEVVATLQYLSPELASTFLGMQASRDRFGRPRRGDDDDAPVKLSRLMDIWSVGMCAMEAIFFIPILKPWYDEWLEETGSEDKFLRWLADTKEQIITGDMRDALQEIDTDMCNLLEGMLEKDPEKRFSIIECINHYFFQKIRHTHLEDLAGILEASDFGEDSSPGGKSAKSPKARSETLPTELQRPISEIEAKEQQRRASRACEIM
ncbi:Calcium-dependent protein kinase 13 [Durusdinium trenchii]